MNPHDHHIDQADRISGAIQGAADLIVEMMTGNGDDAIPDHYRLTDEFRQSCIAILIQASAAQLGRHVEWLKENATGQGGVEDFANNGDLAGAPYDES